MYINTKIKQFFRSIGITLDRYPTGVLRQRMKLIKYFGINTIYDVGASTGQYAKLLRNLGYKGKIISFEPLKDAFIKLKKNSIRDPLWEVFNYGIGDENGEKYLNVSKNSVSSSYQEMLPAHIENSPDSIYIRKEITHVKTFDPVFSNHNKVGNISMLKIDTQGYEMRVLEGAKESLRQLTALQMEMSLSQTYEDEQHFLTVVDYLSKYEFKLFSIEPGHSNKKSGQMYQADGIFFKKSLDQK